MFYENRKQASCSTRENLRKRFRWPPTQRGNFCNYVYCQGHESNATTKKKINSRENIANSFAGFTRSQVPT
ncbi:hypothetical protein HYC85_003185 [Camellia sinensis]|uniref:Uncharacterized protein n=1 Tax=Camellia sinensis TaxID=4442 RepID=A0A7J7IBR2_CAMSI|nr:hypothetical protein HYC85_003185 [Camellia sinensis]